ncbi:hypothetical protein NT239_15760 [Chitinibacter sp. SCUT-21]|uniref:PilX N-terminal domain-containing pilus assembly protein n=1 Tax=Chitinibacter sp. SCUT-21 TaxID=2970891 RepID=UPI0035A5EBAF
MPKLYYPKKQAGVATLLVSVILLLVLAIMTLYSNRSVILEQRSATNEYKQAQALEAAQSGQARFITQIATNWNTYFTQSGTTLTLRPAFANSLNNVGYLNSLGNTYAHNFAASGWNVAISGELTQPTDNDGNTLSGISQSYRVYLAATTTPNRFTLISQGCADTTNCTNPYAEAFVVTDFNIGPGAICPLDINGTLTIGNTYSPPPSIHGFTGSMTEYNCGISVGAIAGNDASVTGCKVDCQNNPGDRYTPRYQVTGSIPNDAHFQKYFSGQTQAQIFAQRTSQNGASPRTACVITGNATQADLTACTAAGISQIYVTGDVNINSSTANFGWGFPAGVELIVGGNFNLNNNTLSMFGMLYVVGNTGQSSLGGSLFLQGTAAFAGNVTGDLSLNVNANPTYSRVPAGSAGVAATLFNGSWRDF